MGEVYCAGTGLFFYPEKAGCAAFALFDNAAGNPWAATTQRLR